MRAGASPYCARSDGFSSTTRSMSSVDRLLVIDESSVESASAAAGSTSFHASPVFVSARGLFLVQRDAHLLDEVGGHGPEGLLLGGLGAGRTVASTK